MLFAGAQWQEQKQKQRKTWWYLSPGSGGPASTLPFGDGMGLSLVLWQQGFYMFLCTNVSLASRTMPGTKYAFTTYFLNGWIRSCNRCLFFLSKFKCYSFLATKSRIILGKVEFFTILSQKEREREARSREIYLRMLSWATRIVAPDTAPDQILSESCPPQTQRYFEFGLLKPLM